MSRSDPHSSPNPLNREKTRPDLGSGPDSSKRSSGDQVGIDAAAAPGTSLKAAVRSLLPAQHGAIPDMIAKAIRDAMTNGVSRPPASQHAWSRLPTIRAMAESRNHEPRLGSVEAARLHETSGISSATTPFGEYVRSAPAGIQHPQEVVSGPLDPVSPKVNGPRQGREALDTAGESIVRPAEPVFFNSEVQPSQVLPKQAADVFFGSLTSPVGRTGENAIANPDTPDPSGSPGYPNATSSSMMGHQSRFQALFSGQGENTRPDFAISDDQTAGSLSPPGMMLAARSPRISSSPFLAAARIPAPPNTFAALLGSPARMPDREPGTNTSGTWADETSSATSDLQRAYAQSPVAFTSADASTGQSADLSRTNELLQQLLDEYRKSRQSYLPLNDRNTSLI